jgi:hypothetical protein
MTAERGERTPAEQHSRRATDAAESARRRQFDDDERIEDTDLPAWKQWEST